MTRKRKIMALIPVFILLIGCTSFVFSIQSKNTYNETFYVNQDGSRDFISIQSAIDNASDGDTIYVENGEYHEKIVIDKQISLIGKEKPIIYAVSEKNVISVISDNVSIIGFYIREEKKDIHTRGIRIKNENVEISECRIYNTTIGISLWNSNNIIIENNYIYNQFENGINILNSNNTLIKNDSIKNCGNRGINSWESKSNRIVGNQITSNDKGIFLATSRENNITKNNISLNKYGLYLQHSNSNSIIENIVKLNQDKGIYFISSRNNTLKKNRVCNNTGDGIFLLSSSLNTVNCSFIQNNTENGIYLSNQSEGNLIYHNNIVDNGYQAKDKGNNIWFNIESEEGNYWSNFEKRNPNATKKEKVWSESYEINGGKNIDKYPLIKPYKKNIEKDTNDKIPGFEVIIIILAITFILSITFYLIYRKK